MITPLSQRIILAFWLLVLTDLAAILTNASRLVYIVKPLLMPVLALLLTKQENGITNKKLILTGLFFSWLGDVFLLLDSRHSIFFIAGLLSFLFTHACYIIYFVSIKSATPSLLKKQPVYILLILCYGSGLVWLLLPYLGQLKIPVIIYAAVICGMLLCSIHVYLKVKNPANIFLLAGSILFVLSDSILAVNKFYQPLPLARTWIMLSYCVAQYSIVQGVLKMNKPDN